MTRFDALVIGTGIAGLSAAIRLARGGAEVCLVSKSPDLLESNSRYAQGGIVARGRQDTPELLKRDIIEAGDNINYIEAVEQLSAEGPELVFSLLADELKVPFVRNGDDFEFTQEAAHSVRRILHVHDYTGRSIMEHMVRTASSIEKISRFENYTAIDIITSSHHSQDFQVRYKPNRALGAYLLNNETGEVIPVFASSVVLATGGAGDVYQHTSNPAGAVGDGIAMAYRAGVEIMNAEYIQFHPTTLFHRDADRFLISESLRGEGARLMSRDGEYFMSRYSPKLKDLAPRDEVARAIYRQIEKEKTGFVYLDARGIKDFDLKERFPSISAACEAVGIDIRTEPVPVVPAAHYFCGGGKGQPAGQDFPAGALRGRRDRLYGSARGKPSGFGVAAGGTLLRNHGRRGYSQWRRHPADLPHPQHTGMGFSSRGDKLRSDSHTQRSQSDKEHDVELCWHHPDP